jgi:hypothetical protein
MDKLTDTKLGYFPKAFGRFMGSIDETFTLVAKMDSIHLALSIVAAKGWEVHQMYLNNEFLHDGIFEDIYMDQPQGFM